MASMIALILKKQGSEFSLIIIVAIVTMISAYLLSNIVLSLDFINKIISGANINSGYIKILLKCIGICFLTEFTCDCCKDASQSAISGAVLLCGRVCVLITALPLFSEFLSFAVQLSGGSV